jgi:hypothetical protein
LPSSTYIDGSFRIEEDDDVIKSYNQWGEKCQIQHWHW